MKDVLVCDSLFPSMFYGLSYLFQEVFTVQINGAAGLDLFRSAFYKIDLPLAIVGTDTKPIIVNNALEQFLQYGESELQGMTFMQFTHPDDIDIDYSLYEEVIQKKRDKYFIAKRWITKTGLIVWGLLTVTPIMHEDEVIAIMAIVQPISPDNPNTSMGRSQVSVIESSQPRDAKTKMVGAAIDSLKEIGKTKSPFKTAMIVLVVALCLILILFSWWLFAKGGIEILMGL